MVKSKIRKFVLIDSKPSISANSEELAKVITERLGLNPRKQGSDAKMYNILLELYERRKLATREKKPELGIMTVEDMALFAGIKRQTMYDYFVRWLDLNIITKASYVHKNQIIRGYRLNGNTIDDAFSKALDKISEFMQETKEYIESLQKTIKNEKIKDSILNKIKE